MLRRLTARAVLLLALLAAWSLPGGGAFLCARASSAQGSRCCCADDFAPPISAVERAPCCKVSRRLAAPAPSTAPAPFPSLVLAAPVALAQPTPPCDPFLPRLGTPAPVEPLPSAPFGTGPPPRIRACRFLI